MARYDSEEWELIATAPRDGTKVRAAHFSNRFFCDWACTAAFMMSSTGRKPNWMEVNGTRGEVYLIPTHWQPIRVNE